MNFYQYVNFGLKSMLNSAAKRGDLGRVNELIDDHVNRRANLGKAIIRQGWTENPDTTSKQKFNITNLALKGLHKNEARLLDLFEKMRSKGLEAKYGIKEK